MTTFITQEDYDVQAREEILRMLGGEDFSTLEIAERMAIDQIKKYIGGQLNANDIFSKTGEERDYFIVMIVIDLAIYHLWSKKAPRSIPELRKQRYYDALEWLTNIGNGSISTILPPAEESTASMIISSRYAPNENKY
jgi:phage gp36-like protein